MAPGPIYPEPRCKRVHLHKSRTRLHRQMNPSMTAGAKVAGVVEDPGRIRANCRVIDLLRLTHPPTNGRLRNENRELTSGGPKSRSVLSSRIADTMPGV